MKAQAARTATQYTSNGFMDPDECVVKYAPLVKRIAHHMMATLPPSVHVDDMIQSGMIGLIDAAKRYQEAQGAQDAVVVNRDHVVHVAANERERQRPE